MATLTKRNFTPEEQKRLQQIAHGVWDEIGYDAMAMLAEEGKHSMPRSHVLELVLDADRMECSYGRRGGKETSDAPLLKKFRELSYQQQIDMVKPAFRFARYGM